MEIQGKSNCVIHHSKAANYWAQEKDHVMLYVSALFHQQIDHLQQTKGGQTETQTLQHKHTDMTTPSGYSHHCSEGWSYII